MTEGLDLKPRRPDTLCVYLTGPVRPEHMDAAILMNSQVTLRTTKCGKSCCSSLLLIRPPHGSAL